MKKNYIFTLLLAFCFSNLSFGQEMLLNGGLEDWADGSPTSWTKAEVLTQSTDAHSGSISAVRTGGSGTKKLSQTITGVIPGNSYTVRFWYKVTAGDETDVRIWCTWKNGSTPVYHAGTSSSAGDDELRNNNGYLDNNGGVWTKHEVTVTAPADVDSFYYEVRSYTGSTAHWDDLSFVNNTVVSNQVVLEDFEDTAPVLSTENGVTATIAANPTVSAEKSMKIVTGAGESWQGGKLMMQTNKIDMRTSDKTLSVKIWSDAARDFLLKLTDGDGGAGNDSKTYVAHSGSGWETLNADFSVSADTGQGGIVANDQYSGLTFYPLYNNSGTTAGGWYAIPDPAYTNYIDDISGIAGDFLEFSSLEDFEGDAPVLSTENGVTATIAANPTVSAEKSMKIVTGAGESWQGGKLMMQTNKIDMRTSDKTLSVKIWSDAARDFLLKLTDGDGGAGNDSKTYVAHSGSGWETLNADFSVSADTGQGGIVANDQYSGLTFYPLYNNSGTTAGGWYAIPDPAYTNYIDDISGIAGDAIGGTSDGDYCEKVVSHLGIASGQEASEIKLTVVNSGEKSMKVTIESNNDDAVDLMEIPGDVTGSPTQSAVDESVAGKMSITLTWAETAPTDVALNILWSKVSTEGNWQLGDAPTTFKFDATCATASIDDKLLVSFSMYPNPASSSLNISASSMIKNAVIYNILGKQVMNLSINKNSESINVSNLASGMYLIKYTTESAIGTAKFIKK